MIESQKVLKQFNSARIKKAIISLLSSITEFINSTYTNKRNNSANKVQFIAQRIDGKKVPINSKL